jgi:hypothetical protein
MKKYSSESVNQEVEEMFEAKKVKDDKTTAADDFVGWLVVFEPKPGLAGNVAKNAIKVLKDAVRQILQREINKALPEILKKGGTVRVVTKP